MADKAARSVGSGDQPVPMKLFATWEVEKSSPNCIPRLCTMTMTRLHVLKPLENELTSIVVAVKMQNSKRILRSNEITVPPGGIFDTGLDLSFSLQYPHFLKRDGNKLLVMLQRRKKYKNRTILGFKTLAIGHVNMSQVLQRSVDSALSLYSNAKERTNPVAQLAVSGLSSQPVDHEDNGHRKQASSDVDRSPDVDNDSDEDEVQDYNEFSSNDEMSDSEPMMIDDHPRPRTAGRNKTRPATSRQRNFKQKFRALIKKFRLTEEQLELDSEADHDLNDPDTNPPDIDEMLDELEDLSDSGPEIDTISVMSTPKPRLRPFFTGRSTTPEIETSSKHDAVTPTPKSSNDNEATVKRSDSDCHTELETELSHTLSVHGMAPPHPAAATTAVPAYSTSPPPARSKSPSFPKPKRFQRERSTSYREKKSRKESKPPRRHSYGGAENVPGKALLEQLMKVLDLPDDKIPESIFLINCAEWQGQFLAQRLQDRFQLIKTCTEADVKASVAFLVGKIQKFCNSNARTPMTIKVGIMGGDAYINTVLRPYVEHFSAKTPDWQTFIKFLLIPFGASAIAKYLGSLDSTYSSLFWDTHWRDMFDKPDSPKLDTEEIGNRVSLYVNGANSVHHVPIAEALIMCKTKGTDDSSAQVFIPFISEVRIGTLEGLNTSTSVEIDDSLMTSSGPSSSPPTTTPTVEKTRESHTPPNSPNISTMSPSSSNLPGSGNAAVLSNSTGEYMDLQVDYWYTSLKPESSDREKDKKDKRDTSSKCSLKTAFRSLLVSRMPPSMGTGALSTLGSPGPPPPAFSMVVVTKEKKQKIMRIGKKAKELESKSQVIDGINRMVCTTKSQNVTLTVVVDGVEWHGVKFFQLSSQWQTHMKNFPVAIFTSMDSF
ncbi:phosphofurin acidic cluster sorting protein 2-like isoform X2 [Pomacea canaliculata]|uniref:phosphofurin acidic cluster sorting protein 2-like isoform X2 n=1 Tax=Pomacea canaliculata TaxID=400727 RepID=UPI000D733096|nr:phosphofurin acidic cluster sorting protein 2-like isoform X2 [Pomacea canaliculata]